MKRLATPHKPTRRRSNRVSVRHVFSAVRADFFNRLRPRTPQQHALPTHTVLHQSVVAWRVYTLFFLAVLLVIRIAIRLVDVQIFQHDKLASMARNEIAHTISLNPRRGTITDSSGNILAMDVDLHSVWANPSLMTEERIPRLALSLAAILNDDPMRLQQLLSQPDKQWVSIARWLDPAVALQVQTLNEPALTLIYEPHRIYPQGEFAAHVIGAVNNNGDGISGVEAYYNDMLKGAPGSLQAEFDAQHNPIAIAPSQLSPPHNGINVRLTIDPVVQHIAETELHNAIVKHNAKGGTVIILEPATGAIKAMVSFPTFDPNHYADYAEAVYGRNPAISTLYEPGSTFKIVTTAAGLQSRAFTADTTVFDAGIISRFDVRLHNWNSAGNGNITPTDMLRLSSNVGAVLFNELTGKEHFYAMVDALGFGTPTGVDMSGEESGIVPNPADATFNDTAFLTNAFGQGIAATPLQMVRLAATVANDGTMMKPFVVAERCWHVTRATVANNDDENTTDERCETIAPIHVRQPMEQGVAWTIRRMLVHAANHYTPIVWGATGNELVPGVEVCAKTGTASIPLPEGGYDPYNVIGSVVGFAPAEDARYALLVKVDEPQGDAWGLTTAVPVFQSIVTQLTRLGQASQ